ncbi:MAG: tyrosine-type recombinase/integrase [Halorientalis sp.]
MEPSESLSIYLTQREADVSESTLQAHKYRLNHFVRWCENVAGIDDVSELSGEDLHSYRLWRREDGDLGKVAEKTQMDTLRVYIRTLERLDLVADDLHTAVISPSLDDSDNQGEDILEASRAADILRDLAQYKYASARHVVLLLCWRTALRTGSLRALDIEDYNSGERFIEVCHREETDTPLKNQDAGERHVALRKEVCDVLDDYIDRHRPGVTDDNGRKPLIATSHGRISKTTLRNWSYQLTQPCRISGSCPHGRDIDECKAANSTDYPYECPDSVALHAVRRGSITNMLRSDVPLEGVGARVDATRRTLEKHYDKRSAKEKMEQRRDYLEDF